MAELAAAAAAATPADAPAAEAPAATEEKRAGDAAGDGDMAPTVEPRPFLPGSASLIEQLDTRVLIVLREGRHLVGVLRSVDQFSNIVLEDTYERHITGNKYADRFLGLYLVKGESLVLVGEIVRPLARQCRRALFLLRHATYHTLFAHTCIPPRSMRLTPNLLMLPRFVSQLLASSLALVASPF